jgi:RNA polymerase sigma-70 factor (ECF subfamily)
MSDLAVGAAPDPNAPYRAGVKDDFDRLYAATYPRVFATLLAILQNRAAAEDATQEAYLRAFRAWNRWRGEAPAEAWIHRVALNVAFSHRRRERIHEVGELIRRLGRPSPRDPTDEVRTDLARELRALPPKQAAAVVLRYMHGFTNREIAHALNVPERTIASRLAAAKRRLRARLGDQFQPQMGTSPARAVPLEQ